MLLHTEAGDNFTLSSRSISVMKSMCVEFIRTLSPKHTGPEVCLLTQTLTLNTSCANVGNVLLSRISQMEETTLVV